MKNERSIPSMVFVIIISMFFISFGIFYLTYKPTTSSAISENQNNCTAYFYKIYLEKNNNENIKTSFIPISFLVLFSPILIFSSSMLIGAILNRKKFPHEINDNDSLYRKIYTNSLNHPSVILKENNNIDLDEKKEGIKEKKEIFIESL